MHSADAEGTDSMDPAAIFTTFYQGWVRFAGYQVKMSAFLPANGLAGGSVFAAASALMAEGKRERREH